MIGLLKKWFGTNSGCESSCNCKEFFENMHAVIDEELTEEEKEKYRQHLDECSPCLDKYNDEKEFVKVLRQKLDKKPCPEHLKSSILEKIQSEPQGI